MSRHTFTSESVTEGHPDKMADQISDSVLDAALAEDAYSRVACETMVTTGLCVVAGEISTKAQLDIARLARDAICSIGYTDAAYGIDGKTCGVIVSVDEQSPDIAMGVDKAMEQKTGTGDPYDEVGAGDQGMMFGYACDETKELMPLPIQMAHQLALKLADVRKKKAKGIDWLRPDGKTQVSVRYEDGQPVGIEAIVVSTQHDDKVKQKTIEEAIREHVIKPVVPAKLVTNKTKIHINPTGRFVIGGPHGDAGLTGRKIIVDTYGGYARHGGGALSGKDPSKVDRSAAYYARYIAKHVVAAKLAKKCEVQFAYAIGVAEPVSMLVDTFGTGVVADEKLTKAVLETFDARPGMLIQELNLRRPIFRNTAAYGHFGRELPEFTWESTPLIDKLREHAKSGNGHAVSNGNGTKSSKKTTGKTKAGAVARA